MKNTTRKIIAAVLLSAFVLSITACNTMAGVGKDTKKAGEKIEQEAKEHKDKDSTK